MYTIKDIPLHTNQNGELVELTQEQREELLATWNEDAIRIKELEALQYQRDRAEAYPSFADQFDTIFHDGLDVWKEQIQAVKDKYPKA